MTDQQIRLGVVGAGAMGAGISQVAAENGIEVLLFDMQLPVAEKTKETIAGRWQRQVDRERITVQQMEQSQARLQLASQLEDLAACDVIVEAIVEKVEVKTALFKQLEQIVSEQTVLASNTSSIPIGAIAAACTHPQRVVGWHFFNPVPLMKLVEIIPGPDTRTEILTQLHALSITMQRTPVVVKDTPGFLVNFGGRAYPTEGLAILHENVAQPTAIDAVMRDSYGFRMGPFELMDLTGIDVNYPVSAFIHDWFFADPRLRSTPRHRYMLETGQLGRKTQRGFYDYPLDTTSTTETNSQSSTTESSAPLTQIYVPELCSSLSDLLEQCGIEVADNDTGDLPILIAPLGLDCTEYCVKHQLDASRAIAIDVLGDLSKRVTLMQAPGANPLHLEALTVSLNLNGLQVTVIQDSLGFIGQRIVAMVANLGCEMAQMGIATPEDIDTAMRLGLNYPQGPLEMVNFYGADTLFSLLENLQKYSGDDRYRPSAWLRRRAKLHLSAHQR